MEKKALEKQVATSISDVVDIVCDCTFPGISRYDGFIPMDTQLLINPGAEFEIYTDATINSLDTPFDMRVLCYGDGYEKLTGFVRVSKLGKSTARRLNYRFSPMAYALEQYAIEEKQGVLVPFNLKNNVPARMAQLIPQLNGYQYANVRTVEDDVRKKAMILLGFQFVVENSFCVYMKPEKAPIGMTLPLYTLSAAKDIFKLRDIEPGRTRRTALKHFVSKHSRRLPTISNETVEIAMYLRGKDKFNWNGFECKILTPKYLQKE